MPHPLGVAHAFPAPQHLSTPPQVTRKPFWLPGTNQPCVPVLLGITLAVALAPADPALPTALPWQEESGGIKISLPLQRNIQEGILQSREPALAQGFVRLLCAGAQREGGFPVLSPKQKSSWSFAHLAPKRQHRLTESSFPSQEKKVILSPACNESVELIATACGDGVWPRGLSKRNATFVQFSIQIRKKARHTAICCFDQAMLGTKTTPKPHP